MEIILKTDIKGLGYKNDLVSVKPGYGRNYLIPQGFAVLATGSNKKILAENIKQAAHKAEKIKTEAENIAAKIFPVSPIFALISRVVSEIFAAMFSASVLIFSAL